MSQAYESQEALVAGATAMARAIAAKSPLAVCGTKRVLLYQRRVCGVRGPVPVRVPVLLRVQVAFVWCTWYLRISGRVALPAALTSMQGPQRAGRAGLRGDLELRHAAAGGWLGMGRWALPWQSARQLSHVFVQLLPMWVELQVTCAEQ